MLRVLKALGLTLSVHPVRVKKRTPKLKGRRAA
jgi:hypothetical protein